MYYVVLYNTKPSNVFETAAINVFFVHFNSLAES